MALGPILTQSISFVFPGQEADGFHDRRLNDLASSKDSPSQSVGAVIGVGTQLAVLANGVVCEVIVSLNARNELVDQAGRNKQFQIGLLVHETILGSPSVDRVRGLDTVHGRLRVDSQESSSVEVDQKVLDIIGLGADWAVAPGESIQLALQETNEDIREILD